ncbi:MAG: ribonuclease HII [bacterium]
MAKKSKYPNLQEEKRLWKQGFVAIAGLDEAGRGPLAGPVIAAAVVFNPDPGWRKEIARLISFGIKDSKKISPQKREIICREIKNSPAIKWGVGNVSARIIDKINILEAAKLAMKKAVQDLGKKGIKTDFLIIDGNFFINLTIKQKPVVAGDQKVLSCAAASIIAKVYRDRLMVRYGKAYPQYGFKKHKGYPTKAHCRALKKHGLSAIHRRSFYPCSAIERI